MENIRQFRAKSSDGMVFFWSGHGDYDQTGHFFKMPNEKRLYRKDVVKAVKQCGARSSTVLTSSCNVFAPLPAPVEAYKPVPPDKIAPLFRSLFLESRGLADINGASEGESGFSHPGIGTSFFHPLFLYLIEKSGHQMTWHVFVKEMRPQVQNNFNDWFPQGYKDTKTGEIQKTHRLRVYSLPGQNVDGGDHRFGVRMRRNRGGGVYIIRAFENDPADKAEVDSGDIILSVNGEDVNTPEEMAAAVARSPRHMRFKMRGGRTGKIYNMTATLRD